MRFSRCQKLLFTVSCLLCIWFSSSCTICVKAANRADLQYYGEKINSYKQYNDSAILNVTVDESCYVFNAYLANSYAPTIGMFSQNQFVYLFITSDDGTTKSVQKIKLTSSVVLDGFTWYYRGFGMGTGQFLGDTEMTKPATNIIVGLPVIRSGIIYDAFAVYYDGVNKWYQDQKGGVVSGDIQIDTTAIEGLLTSSNQYNQSIADDTFSIKNKIEEGLIFDDGFSVADSENLASIRLFLVLCLMILSATYFRNVLAQWLRNVRVR